MNQQFRAPSAARTTGGPVRLNDGKLAAVSTDGPDSKICGKLSSGRTPSRSGSVWCGSTFRSRRSPRRRSTSSCPANSSRTRASSVAASNRAAATGDRVRERLRRGPRQVPAPHRAVAAVQADAHVEHHEHRARGAWLFRVQDEVYWEADFPGVGKMDEQALVEEEARREPDLADRQRRRRSEGESGDRGPEVPGLRLAVHAGVLRIAYPNFITTSSTSPSTRTTTHTWVSWSTSSPGRRSSASTPSTWARSAGCSTVSSPARTVGGPCHGRAAGEALPPRHLATAWRTHLAEEEYAEKIAAAVAHTPQPRRARHGSDAVPPLPPQPPSRTAPNRRRGPSRFGLEEKTMFKDSST